MHKVTVELLQEVLTVPLRHVLRLATKETPEWFALHRRLVQRLRAYGIETLLNPPAEDAAEDARISQIVFRGEIQMSRIVRVERTESWTYTLRGTRFFSGSDALLLGSYMSRPLTNDARVASLPPDQVAIILVASSAVAAERIGIAIARMLV